MDRKTKLAGTEIERDLADAFSQDHEALRRAILIYDLLARDTQKKDGAKETKGARL
jgi:hypothetical protein